jgi:hypothetical protein
MRDWDLDQHEAPLLTTPVEYETGWEWMQGSRFHAIDGDDLGVRGGLL